MNMRRIVWVGVVYGFDDGKREEKKDEEELDGHLEECEELLPKSGQLSTNITAGVLIRTYHIGI